MDYLNITLTLRVPGLAEKGYIARADSRPVLEATWSKWVSRHTPATADSFVLTLEYRGKETTQTFVSGEAESAVASLLADRFGPPEQGFGHDALDTA